MVSGADRASGSELPDDFNLTYVVRDSASTPSVAASQANEMIQEENVESIIGPARSASSGPVALICGITNRPVTGFWASSPTLSDKSTYPTYSRVTTSDTMLASVVLGACQQLGCVSISADCTAMYVGHTLEFPHFLLKECHFTCAENVGGRHRWFKISVLFVDDLWGSGLAEAISTQSGTRGIDIVESQKFTYQNAQVIIQVDSGRGLLV
eukprot:2355477-Rhodomonas_salina.1